MKANLTYEIEATSKELGAIMDDLLRREPELAERLMAAYLASLAAHREALVAVLGPVSAGKTSLVNALVGMEALPTGVVPTTRIPTVVLPSDEREARVLYVEGGVDDVEPDCTGLAVVSQQDPEGHILRVEVEHPWVHGFPALAFMDLPAADAMDFRLAEGDRAMLLHADLVLLCLPLIQPATGELRAHLARAPFHDERLVCVATKADVVSKEDLDALVVHARGVLGLDERVPFLPVSLFPERAVSVGLDHPMDVGSLREWLQDFVAKRGVLPALQRSLVVLKAKLQEPDLMLPIPRDDWEEGGRELASACEESVRRELERLRGSAEAMVLERYDEIVAWADLQLELYKSDSNLATSLERRMDLMVWEVKSELERAVRDSSKIFESRIYELVEERLRTTNAAEILAACSLESLIHEGLVVGGGAQIAGMEGVLSSAGSAYAAASLAAAVSALALGPVGLLALPLVATVSSAARQTKRRARVHASLEEGLRPGLLRAVDHLCSMTGERWREGVGSLLQGLEMVEAQAIPPVPSWLTERMEDLAARVEALHDEAVP